RGFDVEGADRIQLLDAVMQLLDYEYATGENLREMEYIPDDGSAAAAAETAAADLEMAAANAAAAALAAKAEAAAAAGAASGGAAAGSGRGDQGARAAGESGEYGDARMGFDAGNAGQGQDEPLSPGCGDDDAGDQIAREVIEEASSSSSSSCAVAAGGGKREAAVLDESSLLTYVHTLSAEVLRTIGRDMNSLVGMLPAPAAEAIRQGAAFVGDTATRFVGPGLRQAERYTRGLRRGAGKTAGKAALVLKDEVLPRAGRELKAAASRVKRRVEDAIAARKDRREEGDAQQQQHTGRA
ncbi:unnamed protein product, partial [Hapterophycus canaliculatus]